MTPDDQPAIDDPFGDAGEDLWFRCWSCFGEVAKGKKHDAGVVHDLVVYIHEHEWSMPTVSKIQRSVDNMRRGRGWGHVNVRTLCPGVGTI